MKKSEHIKFLIPCLKPIVFMEFFEKKSKELNKDKEKKCRFCGRSESNTVTFNKIAHIIPEFLENNTYFSLNECDDCNYNLSKFEENLKKFLSPDLYQTGIRNKKKKKNFYIHKKNILGGVIANPDDENDIQKFISEVSTQNTHFNINFEKKIITEKIETEKFIPYDAFLGFCKIAMLMAPESELKEMTYIKKLLLKEEIFPGEIIIRKLFLNAKILLNWKFAILFKTSECYILVLNIRNYIYEIAIPKSQSSSAKINKGNKAIPFLFSNFEDETFVLLSGKTVVDKVEKELFYTFENIIEMKNFSKEQKEKFIKIIKNIYPKHSELVKNI